MPSVNDFSEDEENDGPYSGGGGLGGGSGASSGATNTASKQTESGFVPWSRFVSANEDVSKREANDLNTAVQGQVASATKQRDDATKGFNAGIDSNYDITKPGAPAAPKPMPQKSAFGSSTASAFGAAQPQQPAGIAAPPSLQQKAPAGMSAMQASPDAPAMELGDKRTLKASTVANGPTGPKDLQESLGADAWSGLLKDTVRAEGSANALGKESGVQALLQQGGNTPNSAFDAALINGQGQKAFADTSKSGAGLSDGLTKAFGDSQNAWGGLLAETDDARKQKAKRDFEAKATAEADAFNNQPQGGAAETGPTAPGWTPEGYPDLNGFLHPANDGAGGVYEDLHGASQQLSPADWITRALGEAGLDVPMASEAFSGAVSGELAPKEHWQTENIRTGLQQIQNEYGAEAAEWLWNNLTPEMWSYWQSLSNPGSIAREMRKLMEQGGFSKRTSDHDPSEIQAAGATKGVSEYGTTDEQETARTNAYRDGWGTEWDEQWRSGNKNPEKP